MAITGLLISCGGDKGSKKTKSTAAYSEFVEGYTSGVISKNEEILILLSQEMDVQPNQAVEGKVFSFEPAIAGSAVWRDKSSIVFTPEQSLTPGQSYEAKVFLKEIFENPPKDNVFEFGFAVIKSNYEVIIEGLEVAGEDQDAKITGYVETADDEDLEKIKKILQASQGSSDLPITWTSGESSRKFIFSIENVERKDDRSEVKVSWKGSPIGVATSGEQKYVVPGKNEFSVASSRLNQAGENYISITFSHLIDKNQSLKGFIKLGDDVPRYTIDKNELKLYPSKIIYGEVEVRIFKNIRSVKGKTLQEDFVTTIQMPTSKPEIRLASKKGTILPNSDQLVLPFEAVGLKAVKVTVIQIFESNVLQYLQTNDLGGTRYLQRVARPVQTKEVNLLETGVTNLNKWNRFTLELSEMFKIQPGALYQVDISFTKKHSLFACPDTEDDVVQQNWDEEQEESSWDSYENYYYEYDWNERDNPCHSMYYRQRRNVKKILLASNIGLVAKRSEFGALHVFANDILTTTPLDGVEIIAYDYQQQEIGKATTGSNGMAVLDVKRKPYMIKAKHMKDYNYMKVDDGSALSLSNFNTAGKTIKKGIKGFIYGERGVWRPGDDIFLTFILEDKDSRLPDNYPVILEFKNPEGQIVTRKTKTESVSGMYAFKLSTNQEDPTGLWQVKVKAGGSEFNKEIKVETVKPNRLKIDLDFDTDRLTGGSQKIYADLTVKWLHGAVAKNLEAEYDVLLAPTKTTFKEYPNLIFDDDSKSFYAERQEAFSVRLNENGYANVGVNIDVNDNAPGALNAIFTGKVYEEGGNFSVDKLVIPYYPYASYVGLKAPEGDRRKMLLTDKDHSIRIVSVDSDGKPVSKQNLEVELFKLEWRWWWNSSYNDISNYIGRNYRSPLQKAKVNTVNGEGTWAVQVKYPEWGRYYVRVTDPESGHSAGQVIYFDWPGWAGKGKKNMGGVNMLTFDIDKGSYQVGDKAKVTLPAAEGGRALVSLETSNKIINCKWAETGAGPTEVTFDVTEDMTPNLYVHVTLMQPHGQTANDLPIRMYGIENVSVINPATTLEPQLKMPDVLSPEEKFNVKVTESNGKPMAYTIAMVDEGLLDLTRYKTPDPWNNFYAREALGIKTWDIYDDVVGAYSGRLERMLSIGGDGDLAAPKAQKANRFKPVVEYLGPFYLDAGDEAVHEIQMPQYVGSVKTMLVAGYNGAYGKTDKATPVKQSVMVLATLPRVAGPTEIMDLPVTVFNSDTKTAKVKVSVKATDKLKLVGGSTKEITVEGEGEKVIYFKVQAAESLGIGRVAVSAKGPKSTAQFDIEMDVRASNPEFTEVSDKLISAGDQWSLNYSPIGLLGTNEGAIELSALPSLNLESRIRYLIRYPHGCVEQTTSSVFAQLYLGQLMDLTAETKTRISDNVTAAIERLQTFQNPSGGLSYWPGRGSDSEWGTNYAGHFLLEAKNKGYAVPGGMLTNWKKFQKRMANQWTKGKYRSSSLVQAYRLYTLALAGENVMGAMNRMKSMSDLPVVAKWRLALAYAVSGYEDPAKQIIEGLSQELDDYKYNPYTYGSRLRDRAMILETLAHLNMHEEGFTILKEIADKMGDKRKWMSTQTTAYSLIAVSKYSQGMDDGSQIQFEVKVNGETKDVTMGNYLAQLKLSTADAETGVVIQNTGSTPIYARMVKTGIPLSGKEEPSSKNIKMEVSYKDKNGRSVNPANLPHGTDFIAKVKVSHPGVREGYENLALTQIFPSGWEILNTRLDGTDSFNGGDEPDYTDIRDDRVMMYFDLNAGQTKNFEVQLNTSYKGKFYQPAVKVEAMYDDDIYAQNAGKWIEIK